jgi:ribonuclease P protein component
MLSKKYRLPVQSVLRKNGLTHRGPYFFLKKYESALPYARFGVVVSSKVAPLATRRAKIKRLYYEAFRLLPPDGLRGEYLLTAGAAPYESLSVDAIIKELKKALF